ncbi:uncharacterized protein M421DRAFT_406882 [Didymella exigua CBS 183.55]|uniref:Uncharacterized protein n=1 Tax=Didymella exigua CBS 183.55 TaxID=1150837 RepID=A0A6A5R7T0_9PLEO|nr:uncharacterized protein M421DRAFT_406882 [Didymella exigua CBS 183.55]KAF1923389.1 hypothetical protein M421DRAFT_406882 [Didymella exigua CBS 183.55]
MKRDINICYPQPKGIAYNSSPDTAGAFFADSYYSRQASSAKTPLGFNSVLSNIKASPNALGYLGFTLMDKRCTDFVTNIKFVWWSSRISPEFNFNDGQYRGDFHVVIAGSNGYAGTPTQRGFRIETNGSGTVMDDRWLAVSPGEGAAVALNPIEYKPQTSVFQFGADGSLIQIALKMGMAGVAPNQNGKCDSLQYRAVGQSRTDYIKCSGDNLIVCTSKVGYQYAGVCPGRKQFISGLLYFGLAQKMPKDCYWIGLYIDTDISDIAIDSSQTSPGLRCFSSIPRFSYTALLVGSAGVFRLNIESIPLAMHEASHRARKQT